MIATVTYYTHIILFWDTLHSILNHEQSLSNSTLPYAESKITRLTCTLTINVPCLDQMNDAWFRMTFWTTTSRTWVFCLTHRLQYGTGLWFLSLHLLFHKDSFWVWLDWSNIISDHITWLICYGLNNFFSFSDLVCRRGRIS